MKNKLLFFIVVLCSVMSLPKESFSQSIGIGITTPDASAALDITHNAKGLLIPRMITSSINAINNPARGLFVFDSLTNQLMVNMGTPAAPNWQSIASKSNWNLGGNYGINVVTQFVGTNDNHPLRFRVNGILAGELNPATGNILWGLRAGETTTTGYSNIAIGTDALKRNSIRSNLIAIGDSALLNNGIGAVVNEGIYNIAIGSKSLLSNTKGSFNTAIGDYTLYSNTTGYKNTATGLNALSSNTTGYSNTATGVESLLSNSTGYFNTATGFQSLFNNNSSGNTAVGAMAMYANITGAYNTAAGCMALKANIEGNNNTATGYMALSANIFGNNNTAHGFQSLVSNTSGGDNTGVGNSALFYNTTGNNNTAVGGLALGHNTIGSGNTAVGDQALYVNAGNSGNRNTAVGVQTLHATTGSENNTAVGFYAGNLFNMGFNNTMIGANADATFAGLYNSVALGESSRCTGNSQVRLGNAATTSIGGTVGYTTISDGRFKKNIHEEVKGIDFIMKLRPVTYQLDIAGLNKKLNVNKEDQASKKVITEKEKIFFSGFVAQEVEQAAKETGYDFSGVDKPQNENDLYGLRYAEFVVPLVKAFQEQQTIIIALQKQNEELKKNNADQKEVNENLLKRLEKLESSFNAITTTPAPSSIK
jgi:hypothetical protein